MNSIRTHSLFADRYQLKTILGKGGMGVVWRANDILLGREIALKFLPDFIVGDKACIYKLKKETQQGLQLTHPNLVRVFDLVCANNQAAISMEYVSGGTLLDHIRKRASLALDVNEIRKMISEICAAIEYAHSCDVIHRDLKPSNILLTADGVCKVSDFGLSASLGEIALKSDAGSACGTLPYMSPQQLSGLRPTPQDDIYAIGVVLFEMCACSPPFFQGNIHEQIRRVNPTSIMARRLQLNLPNSAIPARWDFVIGACMEKDPNDRPFSAGQVPSLLDDYLQSKLVIPKDDHKRASAKTHLENNTKRSHAQKHVVINDSGNVGYYFDDLKIEITREGVCFLGKPIALTQISGIRWSAQSRAVMDLSITNYCLSLETLAGEILKFEWNNSFHGQARSSHKIIPTNELCPKNAYEGLVGGIVRYVVPYLHKKIHDQITANFPQKIGNIRLSAKGVTGIVQGFILNKSVCIEWCDLSSTFDKGVLRIAHISDSRIFFEVRPMETMNGWILCRILKHF